MSHHFNPIVSVANLSRTLPRNANITGRIEPTNTDIARVFVFDKPRIKKTLMTYYRVHSELIKLNWIFAGEEDFKKLQKGRFQFRDNF